MACSKPLNDFSRLLECPICFERLRTPRILPCLHSYCEECIEQYMVKKGQSGLFPCPMCNEEFKVPQDGAKGFKLNMFLIEVSDLLLKTGEEVKCDACSDDDVDKVATSMCIQCREHLCHQCAQFHCRGSKSFKAHKVVTLDEIRRGDHFEEMRSFQEVYCPTHDKEVLKFYCESCRKPVCVDCSVLYHSQHKMKSVKEAALSASGIIGRLEVPWAKASEHYKLLRISRKNIAGDYTKQEEDGVEKIARICDDFMVDVKQKVDAVRNNFIAMLKKEISSARKQAEAACGDAEHQETIINTTLNYARDLLTSARDVEKLQQLDEIKTRLESLDISNIETQSKKLVFKVQPLNMVVPDLSMKIETEYEHEEIVSELTAKLDEYLEVLGPPVIKEKAIKVGSVMTVMNHCIGLTVTDDRCIVTSQHNKNVKVFDRKSDSLLFQVKQDVHVLKDPVDVTHDVRTGSMFITDMGIKGVVRYDSQGNAVKVTRNLYQDRGHITCHDERLIITDCDGERVLITDLDCNIQQVITKSMLGLNRFSPWYVCSDRKGHLVVSDLNNRVFVIDITNTTVINRFENIGLNTPYGVCVDRWGHILVADLDNHRVVLVSDTQQQKRVIIPTNDVKFPTGLAITGPGELAVLEFYGDVKIFKYADL